MASLDHFPAGGENGPSLKLMWTEAQSNFEKVTKQHLVKTDIRTLDDVIEELERKLIPHDTDASSSHRRFKELASKVLTLINLLGGIAAQGASIVFGPANLCFNAMHYLIDIPTKISRFFDDLTRLFREISTFMKQFKIYHRIEQFAEVDFELRQSAHKLMIAFVDICAISIDVLSGSILKRFQTRAKIALFDNDSGVGVKLEEFQLLIRHQSQISDAVTLEHVVKQEHQMKDMFDMLTRASEDDKKRLEGIQNELTCTHDDVRTVKASTDVLLRDASDRIKEKKNRDDFESLCEKLLILPEVTQRAEKVMATLRDSLLTKTGSWLKKIDAYND
ncbi:hypothetical protein ACLMJK_009064 [Lecanora helva]